MHFGLKPWHVTDGRLSAAELHQYTEQLADLIHQRSAHG